MTEKEKPKEISGLSDNSQKIKLIPGISQVLSYTLSVDNKPMRFYKISYHGLDLDIPIFENGKDIVHRIAQFLSKMSKESCRKELWGLWNTCSVDVFYTSKGKIITTGGKDIVSAPEFSNFVGIDIVGGDTRYESIRRALAKLTIDTVNNKVAYESKKTMIEDFSDWWSRIPKAKIHFSYKKDNDTRVTKN